MMYLESLFWLSLTAVRAAEAFRDDACPDYKTYSVFKHRPFSEGPLRLPYQRPSILCRSFSSDSVERVIKDVTERMVDKDLARLFEKYMISLWIDYHSLIPSQRIPQHIRHYNSMAH